MTYHLDVPESIANSIRLEQALGQYAQGILSFGKTAELAELTRFALADLIGERIIPRHYTEQDLAQDLDYARGQYHLADLQPRSHRSPRSPQKSVSNALDSERRLAQSQVSFTSTIGTSTALTRTPTSFP